MDHVAGARYPDNFKNLLVKKGYLPQQTSILEESVLKFKHKMVAKQNRTRSYASWKHEMES